MTRDEVLDAETRAYRNHKPWMLECGWEGMYCVFRLGSFGGIFASHDDAVSAGVRAYGPDPFLVRRVVRDEHDTNYPLFVEPAVPVSPAFTVICTPKAVMFCEGERTP